MNCGACAVTDSAPLMRLMCPSVNWSALQTYKRRGSSPRIFRQGTAIKARSWRCKTSTLTLNAFLLQSSHIKMEHSDHARTLMIHWLWGVLVLTPGCAFGWGMLKKYGSLENLNMSGNGTIILADKPVLQHFMVVHGICIYIIYISVCLLVNTVAPTESHCTTSRQFKHTSQGCKTMVNKQTPRLQILKKAIYNVGGLWDRPVYQIH